MAPSQLSLKVFMCDRKVCKTMALDPSLLVYDVCKAVRDKENQASLKDHQVQDWGLFLSDDDPKKGIWLEAGRTLEYYLLRDGDTLEYRKKIRPLRVKMMDDSVKTILVDDSQPVSQLMIVICSRIGIANYEEYSLVRDFTGSSEDKYGTLGPGGILNQTLAGPASASQNGTDGLGPGSTYGTLRAGDTLRGKDKTLTRDQRKMEQLKRKLHTDDEINWVDHTKTLREQGIDDGETLLLRRKYFYSDQNIDSRDPVQLNLLYVQCRDAIVNGTHPVTLFQACQFAGIQCQIQFGNHDPLKHRMGFLDLNELIVKDFRKMKGLERKIYEEHKQCFGDNEIDAKVKYVKLARGLKTYGVTFFLVKEKMKGKNKLAPRLLGVTKESVLRLDEKTKEIIKTWQLTSVKRWAASPNSFTLDFGDYQDAYYSVQTPDGEQISRLLAGYIDIILKRKKAKERTGIEGDDESSLVEEIVSPHRATYVQLKRPVGQRHDQGPPQAGRVALTGTLGRAQPGSGSLGAVLVGSERGTGSAPRLGTESDPPQPAHATLTGRVRISGPAHPSRRARVIALARAQAEAGIQTLTGLSRGGRVEYRSHTEQRVSYLNHTGTIPTGSIRTVTHCVGAINAASAEIVSLLAATGLNDTAFGSSEGDASYKLGDALKGAIGRVTTSLEDLMKDVFEISMAEKSRDTLGGTGDNLAAGLELDEGTKASLLSAARDLAQATSDMLECLNSYDPDTIPMSDLPEELWHQDHEAQILTARVLQNQERNLSAHLTKIGEAGARVLDILRANTETLEGAGGHESQEASGILLGLAKGVANAAACLVLRAKTVANSCVSPGSSPQTETGPTQNGSAQKAQAEKEWDRDRIVMAATRCAMRTSELVTCVKIMAPTMNTAVCRDQTVEAAKCVSLSVDHVLEAAQDVTTPDKLMADLKTAATQVVQALDKLIEKVTEGVPTTCNGVSASPDPGSGLNSRVWVLEEREERAYKAIEDVTAKIVQFGIDNSRSDPANKMAVDSTFMIQEARTVAQATSDLVAAIKCEAQRATIAGAGIEPGGPIGIAGRQKSLFEAAKELAEATARLVETAKQFATGGSNARDGQNLTKAAEDLRIAARTAIDRISSHRVMTELQNAARESVESAATVIKDTEQYLENYPDQNSPDGRGVPSPEHDLISHCKLVGERLAELMSGIEDCNGVVKFHDQHAAKTNGDMAYTSPGATLVHSCDRFLGPALKLTQLVSEGRTPSTPNKLGQSVDQLTRSLGQLKKSSDKAHQIYDARPSQIKPGHMADMFAGALEKIEASKNRILTLPQETQFEEGRLGPYGPMAKEDIIKEAKCVGTDMARFITAVVKNDEPVSQSAVDMLAETLSRFADRVRILMGPGSELQKNQIGSELLSLRAAAVLDKCVKAIRESSSIPHRPHPLLQHNLSLCARDLSSCLNDFITALPQPKLNGAAESEPEKMALALAKVKEAQQAIQTAASTPDTGDNTFSNLPMQEKRRVFEQFQVTLQSRARDLNKATQVLLNASTCNSASTLPEPTLSGRSSNQKFNTGLVAAAAEQFSSTFHNFVQAGITVLSTKEPAERQKLVHGLEKISLVAGQLMSTAHQTTITQRDPTVAELRVADDLRNRLVLAARSVTDAVNDLINYCIFNELSAPNDLSRDPVFGDTCRAECQSARQTLEVCRTFMANGPFTTYPKLNDRNQANSCGKIGPLGLSYHKITQDLSTSARQIDGDVEAMTHFARENVLNDFGAALNSWAGNVSSLTEKVAQCGYVMSLVQEISDPRPSDSGSKEALASFLRSNSASNRAPLLKTPLHSVLNVTQLNEAADAIIQACSSIRDAPPGTSQQQILTAATVIAKHTSSLCNCCRLASSRTQDTELKQFFVRSAKDVANATSELVKRIKGMEGVGDLSSNDSPIPSDNDKQSLAQALNPLSRAVKSLVDYASSNPRNSSESSTSTEDFLSNYAPSHESLQAQQPLIEAGLIFLEEAHAMVSSCQRLANDPKSVNYWHEFSRRAHNLSQHMSTLVAISRDLAPGQVNCDRSTRKLFDTLNDLEAITMEALNHGLRPNPSNTAKGFKDDAKECAAQLLPLVDSLRTAGKYEIGLIGMNLNKFDTSIASLVESYVGHVTHSCCMDSRKLISGLDRIKTVLESCQQLVSAVKDGAGDADAERSVHETIDETGEAVKESLRDLTRPLDAEGRGRPVNNNLATGPEEDGVASGSDMSSSAASPRDDPFVRALEGVRNGMIRLTHFDQTTDPEGEGDEARAETRLASGIHRARDISRNLARLAQYATQDLPSSPNGSPPDSGSGLESGVTGIAQKFDQLIDSFLDPNEGIVPQLKILTPTYALCTQPNNAIYELPDRLRYATRQLGESCTEYMKFAGTLYHTLLTNAQIKGSSPTSSTRRGSPGQIDSKTATYLSHSIEEKVNHVLHVLDAISQILPPDATKRRTEKACSQANVALKGLIGDLDTTVLFAATGSLKPDTDDYPSDLFTQHRDVILKTAKSLVEDTKTLVAGAASNPEQLAAAAQSAVRTITKLSEEVKLGAAALGSKDPEAQVLLINAIKDVASALGDLIQATKQASGKPLSDPAMTYLKESAKVMVTNVTSLLKTVKTVEDAKLRGTRALESTIQALTQELRVYDAYDAPLKPTCPDELHRAIYNVHCSASDICVATEACTQEEVISASNQSRRAVQDLLRACKGAAQYAEGEDGKANILDGGKCVAIKCRDMLDILHQIITIQHHEHGNNIARLRGEMDRSFSDLNLILDRFTRLTNETLRVTTAQDGSACYYFSDCGSVYSNDTSSISGHHNMPPSNNMATENELLSAASAIEAAARNLAVLDPVLRPKPPPKSVTAKNIEYKLAEEDEMKQNFDGQILEAAKAIANATAALIRAASAAQRELVMQGKLSPDTLPRANGASRNRLDIYGKEGQWSYGLISAAKLVVAATHSMCQAANDLVKQKRHRLSQENELASSRTTGPGMEISGICEGEESNSNLLLTTCEERLVSSAKSVASSTAQLLVACKVKAGVHNPVTENLQRAGTAIKRATDQLVRAATRAIGRKRECSQAAFMLQNRDSQSLYAVPGEENEFDDSYSGGEDELSAVRYITIDKRMVGSLAQEMEAQQEILRKERELEEARVRLGVIRKAKYKDKNCQGQQINNSNGFINDYQTTYGIESEIYNVPSNPNFKSPAYIINTSEECNYSDF